MFRLRLKKFRLFYQALAVVISFQFIASHAVWAQKGALPRALEPPIGVGEVVLLPGEVLSLQVPEAYGNVKQTSLGTQGKIVIHIQDSHVNYEAQTNIAKLLDHLTRELTQKNNGSTASVLVAIEGASGPINSKWFQLFPNKEIKESVLDYFLRRGYVSGAQYFQVFSDHPIEMVGVETPELYRKNLDYFRKTYKHNEEILQSVKQLEEALHAIREAFYNEALLKLSKNSNQFHNNQLVLTDYVVYLAQIAKEKGIDLSDLAQITTTLEAIELEKKIDYDQVNKERTKLIKRLEKRLTQEDVSELVTESLYFRLGKISSHYYYSFLEEKARDAEINMELYPQMVQYMEAVYLHQQIEGEYLYKELLETETLVREALFQTDDERQCADLLRRLQILKNLSKLELSREELQEYRKNPYGFLAEEFLFYIEDKLTELNLDVRVDPNVDRINPYFKNMEGFYQAALERDQALASNTVKAMEKSGAQIAILVTGGFHTEGMVKIFENQDLSTMIVSPRITEDVGNEAYLDVMLNEIMPLERVLAKKGNRISQPLRMFVPKSSPQQDRLHGDLQRIYYGNRALSDLLEKIRKDDVDAVNELIEENKTFVLSQLPETERGPTSKTLNLVGSVTEVRVSIRNDGISLTFVSQDGEIEFFIANRGKGEELVGTFDLLWNQTFQQGFLEQGGIKRLFGMVEGGKAQEIFGEELVVVVERPELRRKVITVRKRDTGEAVGERSVHGPRIKRKAERKARRAKEVEAPKKVAIAVAEEEIPKGERIEPNKVSLQARIHTVDNQQGYVYRATLDGKPVIVKVLLSSRPFFTNAEIKLQAEPYLVRESEKLLALQGVDGVVGYEGWTEVEITDDNGVKRTVKGLVLEFVEGEDERPARTLKAVLRGGTIEELLSLSPDFTEQIEKIVSGVHARGVVHEDIKDDNFLVDKDGSVVLIDWTGTSDPVTEPELSPEKDLEQLLTPSWIKDYVFQIHYNRVDIGSRINVNNDPRAINALAFAIGSKKKRLESGEPLSESGRSSLKKEIKDLEEILNRFILDDPSKQSLFSDAYNSPKFPHAADYLISLSESPIVELAQAAGRITGIAPLIVAEVPTEAVGPLIEPQHVKVGEFLKGGGQGDIYRAQLDGKDVVVKIFKTGVTFAEGTDIDSYLQRESQKLTQMQGVNGVVEYYGWTEVEITDDNGVKRTVKGLVLEFVEGERTTTEDGEVVIEPAKPLSEIIDPEWTTLGNVLSIAPSAYDQLEEILRIAHEKGFPHHDFTPRNILLRADGSFVVIDWAGISDPNADQAKIPQDREDTFQKRKETDRELFYDMRALFVDKVYDLRTRLGRFFTDAYIQAKPLPEREELLKSQHLKKTRGVEALAFVIQYKKEQLSKDELSELETLFNERVRVLLTQLNEKAELEEADKEILASIQTALLRAPNTELGVLASEISTRAEGREELKPEEVADLSPDVRDSYLDLGGTKVTRLKTIDQADGWQSEIYTTTLREEGVSKTVIVKAFKTHERAIPNEEDLDYYLNREAEKLLALRGEKGVVHYFGWTTFVDDKGVTRKGLVLELVKGKEGKQARTLRSILEPYSTYDILSLSPSFMDQIFQTLNKAYGKEVAHGDLNAGNILADSNGDPVLIDWAGLPLPDLREERALTPEDKFKKERRADADERLEGLLRYFPNRYANRVSSLLLDIMGRITDTTGEVDTKTKERGIEALAYALQIKKGLLAPLETRVAKLKKELEEEKSAYKKLRLEEELRYKVKDLGPLKEEVDELEKSIYALFSAPNTRPLVLNLIKLGSTNAAKSQGVEVLASAIKIKSEQTLDATPLEREKLNKEINELSLIFSNSVSDPNTRPLVLNLIESGSINVLFLAWEQIKNKTALDPAEMEVLTSIEKGVKDSTLPEFVQIAEAVEKNKLVLSFVGAKTDEALKALFGQILEKVNTLNDELRLAKRFEKQVADAKENIRQFNREKNILVNSLYHPEIQKRLLADHLVQLDQWREEIVFSVAEDVLLRNGEVYSLITQSDSFHSYYESNKGNYKRELSKRTGRLLSEEDPIELEELKKGLFRQYLSEKILFLRIGTLRESPNYSVERSDLDLNFIAEEELVGELLNHIQNEFIEQDIALKALRVELFPQNRDYYTESKLDPKLKAEDILKEDKYKLAEDFIRRLSFQGEPYALDKSRNIKVKQKEVIKDGESIKVSEGVDEVFNTPFKKYDRPAAGSELILRQYYDLQKIKRSVVKEGEEIDDAVLRKVAKAVLRSANGWLITRESDLNKLNAKTLSDLRKQLSSVDHIHALAVESEIFIPDELNLLLAAYNIYGLGFPTSDIPGTLLMGREDKEGGREIKRAPLTPADQLDFLNRALDFVGDAYLDTEHHLDDYATIELPEILEVLINKYSQAKLDPTSRKDFRDTYEDTLNDALSGVENSDLRDKIIRKFNLKLQLVDLEFVNPEAVAFLRDTTSDRRRAEGARRVAEAQKLAAERKAEDAEKEEEVKRLFELIIQSELRIRDKKLAQNQLLIVANKLLPESKRKDSARLKRSTGDEVNEYRLEQINALRKYLYERVQELDFLKDEIGRARYDTLVRIFRRVEAEYRVRYKDTQFKTKVKGSLIPLPFPGSWKETEETRGKSFSDVTEELITDLREKDSQELRLYFFLGNTRSGKTQNAHKFARAVRIEGFEGKVARVEEDLLPNRNEYRDKKPRARAEDHLRKLLEGIKSEQNIFVFDGVYDGSFYEGLKDLLNNLTPGQAPNFVTEELKLFFKEEGETTFFEGIQKIKTLFDVDEDGYIPVASPNRTTVRRIHVKMPHLIRGLLTVDNIHHPSGRNEEERRAEKEKNENLLGDPLTTYGLRAFLLEESYRREPPPYTLDGVTVGVLARLWVNNSEGAREKEEFQSYVQEKLTEENLPEIGEALEAGSPYVIRYFWAQIQKAKDEGRALTDFQLTLSNKIEEVLFKKEETDPASLTEAERDILEQIKLEQSKVLARIAQFDLIFPTIRTIVAKAKDTRSIEEKSTLSAFKQLATIFTDRVENNIATAEEKKRLVKIEQLEKESKEILREVAVEEEEVKAPGKGVLTWGYALANSIAKNIVDPFIQRIVNRALKTDFGPLTESQIEDSIVPFVEEGTLLLALLFTSVYGGVLPYLLVRIAFVGAHIFFGRAPPTAVKINWFQRIGIPALISAIAFAPIIVSAIPFTIGYVALFGISAHILANYSITLARRRAVEVTAATPLSKSLNLIARFLFRFQKAVLGEDMKETQDLSRFIAEERDKAMPPEKAGVMGVLDEYFRELDKIRMTEEETEKEARARPQAPTREISLAQVAKERSERDSELAELERKTQRLDIEVDIEGETPFQRFYREEELELDQTDIKEKTEQANKTLRGFLEFPGPNKESLDDNYLQSLNDVRDLARAHAIIVKFTLKKLKEDLIERYGEGAWKVAQEGVRGSFSDILNARKLKKDIEYLRYQAIAKNLALKEVPAIVDRKFKTAFARYEEKRREQARAEAAKKAEQELAKTQIIPPAAKPKPVKREPVIEELDKVSTAFFLLLNKKDQLLFKQIVIKYEEEGATPKDFLQFQRAFMEAKDLKKELEQIQGEFSKLKAQLGKTTQPRATNIERNINSELKSIDEDIFKGETLALGEAISLMILANSYLDLDDLKTADEFFSKAEKWIEGQEEHIAWKTSLNKYVKKRSQAKAIRVAKAKETEEPPSIENSPAERIKQFRYLHSKRTGEDLEGLTVEEKVTYKRIVVLAKKFKTPRDREILRLISPPAKAPRPEVTPARVRVTTPVKAPKEKPTTVTLKQPPKAPTPTEAPSVASLISPLRTSAERRARSEALAALKNALQDLRKNKKDKFRALVLALANRFDAGEASPISFEGLPDSKPKRYANDLLNIGSPSALIELYLAAIDAKIEEITKLQLPIKETDAQQTQRKNDANRLSQILNRDRDPTFPERLKEETTIFVLDSALFEIKDDKVVGVPVQIKRALKYKKFGFVLFSTQPAGEPNLGIIKRYLKDMGVKQLLTHSTARGIKEESDDQEIENFVSGINYKIAREFKRGPLSVTFVTAEEHHAIFSRALHKFLAYLVLDKKEGVFYVDQDLAEEAGIAAGKVKLVPQMRYDSEGTINKWKEQLETMERAA